MVHHHEPTTVPGLKPLQLLDISLDLRLFSTSSRHPSCANRIQQIIVSANYILSFTLWYSYKYPIIPNLKVKVIFGHELTTYFIEGQKLSG
jgi:hypothetical protein